MISNSEYGTPREWLSSQELLRIVLKLNDDEFNYPERVLTALSDIIILIHQSYENPSNLLHDSLKDIIQVLKEEPVHFQYMEISKSALAQKPLIMQLLILMQDIATKRHTTFSSKQLIWLAIALHTSILLKHLNIKTHSHNILMQFKLSKFSNSPTRTWIWTSLPDFTESTFSINDVALILSGILNKKEEAITQLNSSDALTLIKLSDNKSDLQAELSQITKIHTAYLQAHFLKTKKRRRKINKPSKKSKVKPINLAEPKSSYQPNNNPNPYNWDTPDDDIESFITALNENFQDANVESHQGLTPSYEEIVDHYDEPYFSYHGLPDPLISHSAPLQNIDLSLQQNYISQRNLALSSHTRILSLAGYQALFSALSYDAKTTVSNYRKEASTLLLSLLTALPIKSLLTPGYIGHPRIFTMGTTRAYIKHRLGITARSVEFDSEKHENELDIIKIPIPTWLIDYLLAEELTTPDELTSYLALLRNKLGLPYLSVNRVETALHVLLSRHTPNCNTHIADLICRTPAPHAPALYYSSHTSEELIDHYKAAIDVLNKSDNFDLSYISTWHKYSLGSSFAFTPQYVREIISNLIGWVDTSFSPEVHFNRTSILVWFIFCLLTGVRPNNDLAKVADIDLESGWLLVNDKPSKAVKNHRLVPLCTTLLNYLNSYKSYLIDYQLKNPLKHDISISIDRIRLENKDEVLLKLLTDNAETLKNIKRGDAYQLTKDIIDVDPYWTRHFVRTQLEKHNIHMSLINTIIGHEKARQEGLGRFSSMSKADIKKVAPIFEDIANVLGLNVTDGKALRYYNEVINAH